jgi:hypothetical protein
MKTLSLRPLSFAIVAALTMSIATPAFAQSQDVGAGGGSMREQRAKRLKELGREQDSKEAQKESAPLYPNATRKSPEAMAKGKGLKELQDLQALYEKQDSAAVTAATRTLTRNPSPISSPAVPPPTSTTRPKLPTTSRRPSMPTASTTTATIR